MQPGLIIHQIANMNSMSQKFNIILFTFMYRAMWKACTDLLQSESVKGHSNKAK